jgi:Zn-dependent protease with chaperone function
MKTSSRGSVPDSNSSKKYSAFTVGALAMPNLYLISIFTVFLLYAVLTLAFVTVVELGYLDKDFALVIGIVFAIIQFTLGPWIMDLTLRWLYTISWVGAQDLPDHLQTFVNRVCLDNRMQFPSFGIIEDGAPQAFTYGHHPNNARIVISRGLIDLLSPEELEAVVAHEIGHAKHWDMVLMTIVNLVPLLLYYIYRSLMQSGKGKGSGKGKNNAWPVALGAYILYIISEYIVLWFSRIREYYADRFSGIATGNPNALVRALVKIAYGLAAQDSRFEETEEGEETNKKERAAMRTRRELTGSGAIGALNIFSRDAALNLVMTSSSMKKTEGGGSDRFSVERVKDAMQWDLWNPWAEFFELNSTHPLVAKRLQLLGAQAVVMGQEPLVLFDRIKPESYWDEFLVDLSIMALPVLGILSGLGLLFVLEIGLTGSNIFYLGIPVFLMGTGGLIKTLYRYPANWFPKQTVEKLMGPVKVSPVRPVPATLTGTIIGKGVPGLIYSEDFVLRDETGIMFLDYNQPLAVWNFMFGLLKAGEYQEKNVRVSGWFRRSKIPYFEISRIEVIGGFIPPRYCRTRIASLCLNILLMLAGCGMIGYLVQL